LHEGQGRQWACRRACRGSGRAPPGCRGTRCRASSISVPLPRGS
jgi:hypothetical protein